MACEACGLTAFEQDPDGRLICANCDHPQPAARVAMAPCPTPKCGQPVPVDPKPGMNCLVCQKPIKNTRKAGNQ